VRRVILTGDDFGIAVPVNEAIEEAHRSGVLTTASLMVSGAAADDAVRRARRLPGLRVGLHVVLVEGRPVLHPSEVPDLVDAEGEFSTRLVRTGMKYVFSRAARRQLAAEIRAQFEAFRSTGLELDHANAHNHMHLHPTILALILRIGREFGLRAVRVPREPIFRSWGAARRSLPRRLAWSLFLSPQLGLMRIRLKRADLRANDFVFGLHDSGAMGADLFLRILDRLPEGVTEIYFHPATRRCPEIDRSMPGYRHEDELRTLTSGDVRLALHSGGVERIAFGDLV
jgi:hopanoid biosynthesis associated protein HpnK